MAIFPAIQKADTIDLSVIERGINFLFDFDTNDFVVKDGKIIELVGNAAVVFWIEKTLRTEFEKAQVYKNTEYGTIIETNVGKSFPLEIAKNIFEENIKSSLLKHERISSISNFTLSQEADHVTIGFEVALNQVTEEKYYYSSTSGFTRISTLEEIKEFIGIKLITSDRFYFKSNIGQQIFLR